MANSIRITNRGGKNELVALQPQTNSTLRPEIDLPVADVTVSQGKRISRWQAIPSMLIGRLDSYKDIAGYGLTYENCLFNFTHTTGFVTVNYIGLEGFEPAGHSWSDDGLVAETGNASIFYVELSLRREKKRWAVFSLEVKDANCDPVDFIMCSNELAGTIDDGIIMVLDHLNGDGTQK